MPSFRSNTYLAGAWMLGAIAAFSALAMSSRAARTELPTFELMMFRSVIGLGLIVIMLSVTRQWHVINNRRLGLHFTRNLSHFIAQNLWLFAIPSITLAQLISLEFSSPIWILLLSSLFLGEALTFRKILCAAIGFAGVIIVAQPSATNLNPAILAAALAAIGFAGSAVFTKQLTTDTDVMCILFWLAVIQALMGLVCALWDGTITVPSTGLLLPLSIVSFTGLAAHYCLTRALALAPASIVMPMDFLRLPTLTLLGYFFYGEQLHLGVFFGAALIIAANILNMVGPVAPILRKLQNGLFTHRKY